MTEGFRLREAVNVPDLKERDALVRRMRETRSAAARHLDAIEQWNRAHPDEEPIAASFERAIIDWCDGKGSLPTLPTTENGEP
jgi:hypothetical protein